MFTCRFQEKIPPYPKPSPIPNLTQTLPLNPHGGLFSGGGGGGVPDTVHVFFFFSFFHPRMKFHPYSSWDEISSQQKRVNSKRHFTIDRDKFIPGRVSSRVNSCEANCSQKRKMKQTFSGVPSV